MAVDDSWKYPCLNSVSVVSLAEAVGGQVLVPTSASVWSLTVFSMESLVLVLSVSTCSCSSRERFTVVVPQVAPICVFASIAGSP